MNLIICVDNKNGIMFNGRRQSRDRAVCEEFFKEIGVDFVFEGDKAYPASLQAASVVDCLRFAAEESGVTVCTETAVTSTNLGMLFRGIRCQPAVVTAGQRLKSRSSDDKNVRMFHVKHRKPLECTLRHGKDPIRVGA